MTRGNEFGPGRGTWTERAQHDDASNPRINRTAGTPYEPSAWMRAQVDKVRAEARSELAALPREAWPGAIVAPLGLTSPEPGTREDRCCDRCGAYVPADLDMFTVVIRFAGPPELLICGGLCDRCGAKETPAPRDREERGTRG